MLFITYSAIADSTKENPLVVEDLWWIFLGTLFGWIMVFVLFGDKIRSMWERFLSIPIWIPKDRK